VYDVKERNTIYKRVIREITEVTNLNKKKSYVKERRKELQDVRKWKRG